MGMSSSQARLLNLTARMHQIEYKAAKLEAQKLQMANDSKRVYEDYLIALDATKVRAKIFNTDGSLTAIDLTGNRILDYNVLMNQYVMKSSTDKAIVSTSLHNNYSNTETLYEFLEACGIATQTSHTEYHNPRTYKNPQYIQESQHWQNDHTAWKNSKNQYNLTYEEWQRAAEYWDNVYDPDWQRRNAEYQQYRQDKAAWDILKADWDKYHNVDVPNYNSAYATWQQNYINWQTDRANWVNEKATWEANQADWTQYNKDYADWYQDGQALRSDKTKSWWVEQTQGESLQATFDDISDGCFSAAKNGSFGCYAHVLERLIDFQIGEGFNFDPNASKKGTINYSYYNQHQYTTSTGSQFKISVTGATVDSYRKSGKPVDYSLWAEISDLVDDEATMKPYVANDEVPDITADSSVGKKLLSKYYIDSDGNAQLKSLKQWAIDLRYVCGNSGSIGSMGITKDDVVATTVDFQNSFGGQLVTTKRFNEEKFEELNPEYMSQKPTEPAPKWTLRSEPQPPTEPTLRAKPADPGNPPDVVENPGPEDPRPVFNGVWYGDEPIFDDYVAGIPEDLPYPDDAYGDISFDDIKKVQWYTNLWYKMEGMDEIPVIYMRDAFDTTTMTDIKVAVMENKAKTETNYISNKYLLTPENENYIVVADEILNNNEKLTDAINEGYIILQSLEVPFNETFSGIHDEMKYKTCKFRDTSVTVDTKMEEVADEKNLKKAEADYEAKMRAIDRKDRHYDTQLAALETERNAIKQEMDTLKTVAKDNVERTFKLFS